MIRFVLIVASLLSSTALLASASGPNIVWLVSEDNSAQWLRLYDPNGAAMPNVEKLAKHGLVFNHAFSCGAVCSVARSTIISGCYAPRVGTQYHRRQQAVAMPQGLKMFPYYLRQAGYYTTNCAKQDYNFEPDETGGVWDKSSKKATYRDRKPGQPFFHVQNYHTTHEGTLHFSAKAIGRKSTTAPSKVKPFAYHPDTKTFRYTYARYLDNHIKLDKQIGKFLQGLEDDGLMDDTFIFYYGDHGGVLPRGKGYVYNNGLHVPMVVHIPKNWKHLAPAQAGSRIDGFVEFVDLSATVLNLAGAKIPAGMDGKPFLGNGVSLEELNRRDTTFGYADRFDEKYDLVRTLRKGRFTYLRNYQPFNFDGLYNSYRYKMAAYREWRDLYHAGKLDNAQKQFFEPRPAECLYDLDADPHEVKNLAEDPAYADKLHEMRGLLQQKVKSLPDLSFIPEPVFLANGRSNPVEFGESKKKDIGKLVDIADLYLKSFADAKHSLEAALSSANPWERYWGLITCSAFGKQSACFYDKAKELAAKDNERLVRIRAAEFLGLVGEADPRPIITDVLHQVTDSTEALLILNSAALLHDSQLGYEFDLSEFKTAEWAKGKKSKTLLRLKYLSQKASRPSADSNLSRGRISPSKSPEPEAQQSPGIELSRPHTEDEKKVVVGVSNRPNIIYILADDLGYGDLGCYGQEVIETPNIDKLCASGMRFTNHHSGSTVCAPSRACLMTGQHTGHVWVRANGKKLELRPDDDDITIARMLKTAGYHTAMIGKAGTGCDVSVGQPNRKGFDYFYGFNGHGPAHHYFPPTVFRNSETVNFPNNKKHTGDRYIHDEFMKEIMNYLDERGTSNQPFFLHYAALIPHASLVAPEKWVAKYRDKVDEAQPGRTGGYAPCREPKATFAGMVSRLDWEVGQIMEKLESMGIADNTLVFFASDNGPHSAGGNKAAWFESSGGLRGQKRDVFEGGVRVPLIANWPGKITPGSESDHLSAFWDVMPTVCQIVGVESPANIDGISFLPTLLGKTDEQRQHKYLYWEFYEKGGRRAALTQKWKAVQHKIKKRPGPIMLFDIQADLHEAQNVAKQHPEIVAKFEAIFEEAHTPSPITSWKK